MSQAEGIRRYVLTHYVDPARAAGEDELTIRAGDVCRAMGLQGRTPNVCSVLGSRKFLAMAGLRLLGRVGPAQSTTTTYCYALGGQRIGAESAPTTGAGTAGRRAGERPDPAAQRRGTDRRREADSRDCLRRQQIGVRGTPDARKRPAHQIRRRSAGGVEGRIDELPASGRRGAFRADVETGAGRVQQVSGGQSARTPAGVEALRTPDLSARVFGSGRDVRARERVHLVRRMGARCRRVSPPGTMTSHSRRRQAPRSEGGDITDSTISRCCRR